MKPRQRQKNACVAADGPKSRRVVARGAGAALARSVRFIIGVASSSRSDATGEPLNLFLMMDAGPVSPDPRRHALTRLQQVRPAISVSRDMPLRGMARGDRPSTYCAIEGNSRGCAFITFRHRAEAELAVARCNGMQLAGRAMKVMMAERRRPPAAMVGTAPAALSPHATPPPPPPQFAHPPPPQHLPPPLPPYLPPPPPPQTPPQHAYHHHVPNVVTPAMAPMQPIAQPVMSSPAAAALAANAYTPPPPPPPGRPPSIETRVQQPSVATILHGPISASPPKQAILLRRLHQDKDHLQPGGGRGFSIVVCEPEHASRTVTPGVATACSLIDATAAS